MRLMYLVLLLFSFISTLSYSQDCDMEGIARYRINARTTDKDISFSSLLHHVYLDTNNASQGPLMLYFVGSYDKPSKTTFFPLLAACRGYHVIVLEYPNKVAAKSACAKSDQSLCYTYFRKEILEGKDYLSSIDIAKPDGILNRTLKLLQYLDAQHPSQGWNKYYDGEQILWENITVAGHSQGGGHALFISTQKKVKRAIGFAAPNDYSERFGKPALWTQLESATPKENQYVFLNLHDDVVPFEQQYAACQNLGLPTVGDSLSVDKASSPYDSSHVLYTRRTTTGFGGNHSLLVRDQNTPLDNNGIPIFLPVWTYLLGPKDTMSATVDLHGLNLPFHISPNPGSDYFQLDFSPDAPSYEVLRVVSLRGQTMLHTTRPIRRVNTETWPSGLYQVEVTAGQRRYMQRWTKQ